jgi:hypothetical protein
MVKKTNKKRYLTIASVLLAAVLIIGLVVGLSSAKYKTEKRLPGEVKFTVKLADKILIQEHEAVRQPDGSYVLISENIVEDQSYKLMPGVDIPKDPYITIEGKTPIPAYLYVEVVELIKGEDENGDVKELSGFPNTIEYNLIEFDESNRDKPGWTLLLKEPGEGETDPTPVTGPNGGKVYVYSDIITDKNAQIKNNQTGEYELVKFQILDFLNEHTTDTIEVSDALPRGTEAKLNFYAYICQKYTDDRVENFSLTTSEPAASTEPTDGASAGGN